MRPIRTTLMALLGATCLMTTLATSEASAQEVQITGPLAGAPAVRRLRLRREGRFDIGLHGTFSLLDEFRRSVIPGLRVNYHFTDWLGVGLWGGYSLSFNTALADEVQTKAIDARDCENNPQKVSCKRSAVSLCRGPDCLNEKQLGRIQWMAAPQITVVPFRGKLSLFGAAFVDTDISIFAGPAFVGLEERAECATGDCPQTFDLESTFKVAPTFGLGFNFYPADFLSFGAEFRATPFAWNTSGFDVAGADPEGNFPDGAVDSDDSQLQMNPMLSVFVSVQLPTELELSD